ncbi:MAG: enoyl-CoA hydratase/isomerase family protein, partial [Gammaproteobacteria bacterium]
QVLFEEREVAGGRRIGVARLNRPQQLNALTLEMCQLLLDRFRAWASDEGIVAVLLEGAGDKGFCAGGDVASVIREVRAGGPQRYVYGDAFFEVEYRLDLLIHTYPKPLVAWSHGVCMGGGVGLTVGASHRIVSERSRIAMPEIHIGLFPDVGGGWFLNRLPGKAGTVLALTGMHVNEADALFAGLADVFIPEEGRGRFNDALLSLEWSGEARADRERLTRLCLSEQRRWKAGLPVSNLQQYFEAIRFIASQPTVAGVRDALLAAAEEDPYFRVPADNLANGSPTAAHVTFEYLRRTQQMSIAQVLDLDLVLARRFQRLHDFSEGVRALLIDKDRAPSWSPSRFEDVEDSLVESHFSEPAR